MFHHFTQPFSTFAIVAMGVAYAVVSILVAPNQPRHKTDSNKRATLGPCPPSSASTAENSPATDHAAPTASRNAPHASTPDPRATPHSAASGRHTAYVHKR